MGFFFFVNKENFGYLNLLFKSFVCFFLFFRSNLMSRKKYVNGFFKDFGFLDIESFNENG